MKSFVWIFTLMFLYIFPDFAYADKKQAEVKKQREEKEQQDQESEKTNFYVGGDFRIDAFAVELNFDLYPHISYQLPLNLKVGAGPFYFFRRNTFLKKNRHFYGSKAFIQYYYEDFFAHVEGELLLVDEDYLESFNIDPVNKYKKVWGVLLGAGYNAQISDYFSAYFIMGWNINRKTYTPYENPVLRLGVTYNL